MKHLYSKGDERYLVCDKESFDAALLDCVKPFRWATPSDGGVLEVAGYAVFYGQLARPPGVSLNQKGPPAKVVLANEQYRNRIVALLEADGFHVTTQQ